jgi:hypothetical protein
MTRQSAQGEYPSPPLGPVEAQVVVTQAPEPKFVAGDESFRRRTLVSLRAAVEQISYLEVTHGNCEGNLNAMVTICLRPKKIRVAIEAIKADIRHVWQEQGELSPCTFMKFVDTLTGFDFRFAISNDAGAFVTGIVRVDVARESWQ